MNETFFLRGAFLCNLIYELQLLTTCARAMEKWCGGGSLLAGSYGALERRAR